jgi:hypothetical protein
MAIKQGLIAIRNNRYFLLCVAAACVLVPLTTVAQLSTGSLIGTAKDAQGAVISGAVARVHSAAVIGGTNTQITNDKGQFRFPALPPGQYLLEIEFPGFTTFHEADIRIGVSSTIERTAEMKVAGVAQSISVEGAGSRIEARDPGFGTRFGLEDLKAIPTRRSSMFDFLRAAPGISPTSPSSGTTTTNTVSAFGSGTNENQFLFDGTNFTCPCNGVARAEPGIDFIQEVQVQSVGASAEYGNVQGAVINVITRQGSERFLYDASYYGQTARLTSRPVLLAMTAPRIGESGYERGRYRDFTTNLGGPMVRNRVWFFTGYQHLRDYDSQPGADPAFPRTYKQDKMFGKLTWKLTPRLQLVQSLHDQFWVNPDRPTQVTPFESIVRPQGSVPAITFGHLTHTLSPNTLWDVRLGRFVFSREEETNTDNLMIPSRIDRVTGVSSGAPPRIGILRIARTTVKATISQYRPGMWGADHQWKAGTQIERGEHRSRSFIPTGVRYEDRSGDPFEAISTPPSNVGGVFVAASAFVSDAITLGAVTINAGVRFDHSRAFHQDLPALDPQGRETAEIVRGQGTLYTWNLLSPRFGVTAKLASDGRTILRASYGRFSQGMLTGELEPFHPGATATTIKRFNPVTGDYTSMIRVIDPKNNLRLDSETRALRTDEFSIGVDREVGRQFAVAIAYVRKDGRSFIGWTDVGGAYREETRTAPDGSSFPVFVLLNAPSARLFRLTNPEGYSLTYNGLVVLAEKRRSHGLQAFGSYTFSRATGLQPSSGAVAGGPQVSTVSPPQPSLFGRDPNDLTNAYGRLPNDRPHMLRAMGSVDVPRTGFVIAANLQQFSGKPWAATAQIPLPQADQRILLEPRGSRRLSSQALLDLRVSRTMSFGELGRIELLVDVLNVLNDTAEEGLASDNLFSSNFGRPTIFMDPRRVMAGVRVNLGR